MTRLNAIVLGAAAGGGFPQWNCRCPVCRLAWEGDPRVKFWPVRDRSLADIWANSPAFNAFRGTDWMKEPCRSCARRDLDFGGCRCQAFAITGDARAADPVCHLSPHHDEVVALRSRLVDAGYSYCVNQKSREKTPAGDMR
jgi:radical SAM protein with 4Fe4S-binding SPASM domain